MFLQPDAVDLQMSPFLDFCRFRPLVCMKQFPWFCSWCFQILNRCLRPVKVLSVEFYSTISGSMVGNWITHPLSCSFRIRLRSRNPSVDWKVLFRSYWSGFASMLIRGVWTLDENNCSNLLTLPFYQVVNIIWTNHWLTLTTEEVTFFLLVNPLSETLFQNEILSARKQK